MDELPIPDFYRSEHAASWDYRPDEAGLLDLAHAWAAEHAIRPAASDELRVRLLLVDVQKDFCLPAGNLYVGGRSGRGAVEDSDRLARFVYRNLRHLTEISCTLDTHLPFQIFFPSFWVDREGEPLLPNREISAGDIRSGAVRPKPGLSTWLCNGDDDWLLRQVEFYCDELERAGRYRLYLWPPHCLLGSPGHALVGVLQEARLFHAFARTSPASMEIKGELALSENYSVLSPEVLMQHDGDPLAQRNAALIDALLAEDRVIVAGQASSHCVKSTLDDLLAEMHGRGRDLLGKVYILEDCMSAVAVPDPDHPGSFLFDFTDEAEAALARFADAGMHVVRSTDPIASWPGFLPRAEATTVERS